MHRRVSRQRRVIGALSLVAVAVLTYVVAGRGLSSPQSKAGHAPCVVADESYLTVPAGFERMTNITFSQLPAKGRTPVPSGVGGFTGGRLVGFINRVALMDPYISWERARALSLGYHLGRWPLVPLEGPVVRSTPGVLELYQAHFAFATQDRAINWARQLADSSRLDPYAHQVALSLPAEAVAFETTMGPADGQHEHAVLIYGSRGAVAFQLSVQGGGAISAVAERSLVVDAISRLESACGG